MNSVTCRHEQVLEHFQQRDLTMEEEDKMACCDNCGKREMGNHTASSRILLQTLSDLQSLTMSALCDTLSGTKSKSSKHLQDNAAFGKGGRLTSDAWKALLQHLIGQGFVDLSLKVYPGAELNRTVCYLQIAGEGAKFLEDPEKIILFPGTSAVAER